MSKLTTFVSERVDPNVPGKLSPCPAHLSTFSWTHPWGMSCAIIPLKVVEYKQSEASKRLPWCGSFTHPSSCSERLRSQKRMRPTPDGPRIKPSNSATHEKHLKKYTSAGTYNCKASLSDLPNGFLMCVVIFAFKHWCEQMLSCLSRARLHIPPQPSLIMTDENSLWTLLKILVVIHVIKNNCTYLWNPTMWSFFKLKYVLSLVLWNITRGVIFQEGMELHPLWVNSVFTSFEYL